MNMNNNCGCCAPCWTTYLYTVFRIVLGGLFLWHGIVKFPGAQGWFLAAGIIEIVVGALLVLGLFTRWAAILGAVEMIVAICKVHLAGGNWTFIAMGPGANGGEAALLYLAGFLALIAYGSGAFAIQNLFGNCCDCCEDCGHDHAEEAPMVVTPAPMAKPAKKKSRR